MVLPQRCHSSGFGTGIRQSCSVGPSRRSSRSRTSWSGTRARAASPSCGRPAVQVNDPADPLRAAIGGTQYRVDGVVMADQHQLRRVEVVDQLHHILDVRLQVGARPSQVAALPEAGEGQRVHLRPRPAQPFGGLPPDPATGERSGNQYERRHDRLLACRGPRGRPYRSSALAGTVGTPLREVQALSPDGMWSIGELAEQVGVTVKTVRFYSDRGLLPEVSRSSGGHRRYGPDALERLRLIRSLRTLDLPVPEVGRVLDHGDGLADALEDAIDGQLRELGSQLTALRWREAALQLIRDCPAEERADRLRLVGRVSAPPSTAPLARFWRGALPVRLSPRLVSSILEYAVPQPPHGSDAVPGADLRPAVRHRHRALPGHRPASACGQPDRQGPPPRRAVRRPLRCVHAGRG